MIPQLGLAHFSAISLPPLEFAALAAEAGFARIGLRLCAPFPGAPHYPLRAATSELRTLRQRCVDLGIEVYDIEAVVIDANFVAQSLAPALEAAAELGAKRLSVAGDDASSTRLSDNFVSLCELANAHGIGVDLENMGWRTIATFAQAHALIEHAEIPSNAGVLVDAIHFFRNGGELAELTGARPRIQHVQLCDVKGPAPTTAEPMVAEARSGRFAPGDGELPLEDMLKAVGDGIRISVEVPMTEGGPSARAHIQELLTSARRLLQQASQSRRG